MLLRVHVVPGQHGADEYEIDVSSLPPALQRRWAAHRRRLEASPLWTTWATVEELAARTGRDPRGLRWQLQRCLEGRRWLGARVDVRWTTLEGGREGYLVRVGSLPEKVREAWEGGEERG